MQDKKWWTVQEIAQLLRVSERTVRLWIERKQLVAFRIGLRGYRIEDADLQRFIEERKRP